MIPMWRDKDTISKPDAQTVKVEVVSEKISIVIGDIRYLADPGTAVEIADEIRRAAAFLNPELFPFHQ